MSKPPNFTVISGGLSMSDPAKDFDKVTIPMKEFREALFKYQMKLDTIRMTVQIASAMGAPMPNKAEAKEMMEEALKDVFALFKRYGVELTEREVQ